jgi:hypothetical protein
MAARGYDKEEAVAVRSHSFIETADWRQRSKSRFHSRRAFRAETISWNAQRSFCATVNDLQRQTISLVHQRSDGPGAGLDDFLQRCQDA